MTSNFGLVTPFKNCAMSNLAFAQVLALIQAKAHQFLARRNQTAVEFTEQKCASTLQRSWS